MSVGVHECAPMGRACLESQMRGKEETEVIERKDRRANLPGLLLVRQIFSRWGGRGGEVQRTRGSRGSANTFRKQKCITVHVSKKMSWELTWGAGGGGRVGAERRESDVRKPLHVTLKKQKEFQHLMTLPVCLCAKRGGHHMTKNPPVHPSSPLLLSFCHKLLGCCSSQHRLWRAECIMVVQSSGAGDQEATPEAA